jgi:isochorismate synthase EntC
LTVENNELKLRLQTMEQQVHLQDELNEALKEEIQHLKVLTGQVAPSALNYGSFGSNQQQFYSNNQSMQTILAAKQFQQLQIHSQKQQQQQQQQQQQHQQQQQQQQQYQFQQQQMQQLMQQRLQQQEQQNGVRLKPSQAQKEN